MRAFIAIDLPEELKKKIFVFSREIARNLNIKLVEKENLHLTMMFLGEIDEDKKEKIKEGLGGLEGQGKIRLQLGEIEIFPDRKKPCGVWINLEGEREKLFSLYKKIVDGLLKVGVRLENRNFKFSPHITIGRIKKKAKRVGVLGPPAGGLGKLGGEFMAGRVTLYQSQLCAKGPKYTKLGEFEVK